MMLLPALFLGCLMLTIYRPKTALVLAVFFLPWQGLTLDLGLRVTPYRLLIASLLIAAFLRPSSSPGRHGRVPLFFWLFILYSAVWTLSRIPVIPTYQNAFVSVYRSAGTRLIAQCVYMAMQLAPLFVIPRLVSDSEEIRKLGRIYLVSCAMLAALGLLQLLTWFAFEVDLFPLGLIDYWLGTGTPTRQATVGFSGIRILRICSLGGEPKGLGQSLAVGLLIIQIIRSSTQSSPRSLLILWGLMATALLFTWSTSAFFVWLAGSATHIVVVAISSTLRRYTSQSLSTGPRVILASSVLLLFLVSVSPFSSETFLTTLERRTLGRAHLDDYDSVVLDFLKDQPNFLITGTGMGAVHLYAAPYIPQENKRYMDSALFIARSTWLNILSEQGLIGLALFMLGCLVALRRILRSLRQAERYGTPQDGRLLASIVTGLILVLFPGFMIRLFVADHMYFLLGLALFLSDLLRRRSHEAWEAESLGAR